jgi:PAS domain S-box-containing protein
VVPELDLLGARARKTCEGTWSAGLLSKRGGMQADLPSFQRRQLEIIARVTPHAMAGHILNTTVLAFAVAGSIPTAELILWCFYSYVIALVLLYRHVKGRGRAPRNFRRAASRATVYAFLLALPWSTMTLLHLGALGRDQELILIVLAVGMAATGTVLLSAIPSAAISYMSGILLPGALKCLIFLDQSVYLLLGVLALSYWWFLAALIGKIAREITERQQAEEKLHETEGDLRRLLGALTERTTQLTLAEKSALVGTFAYDVGSDTLQISDGYAAIHGFPNETREIARSRWLAGVHPEDRARLDELRERAFCMRSPEYTADFRILCSGSGVRWIEGRAFVGYRSDGSPHRVVGVNIDVTDRKRAEEHLHSLNAELDHRVKNVLATVSAVAAHTLDPNGSVNAYVDALHGRLRSMASTHELLSHRSWRGIPLRELLRRELAPYATDDNTQIMGPEVTLSAEAGHAIAMVFHELTTNAAKYGALCGREGRVSVRWYWPTNGNAPDALVIEWQEIGGPAVAAPGRSGYGTSVIRDLVPYELRGSVDLVLAPEGLRCRLEIPAKWVSTTIGQDSNLFRPNILASASVKFAD